MKPIFLKEMRLMRRGLITWCALIGLTAVFGILEYPFVNQYLDMITPALVAIPPLAQVLFGIYQVDFTTPLGYYLCMYYWCGLLAFAHAILTGVGVAARDLRDKTAEYIYTTPHPRERILGAKALAAATQVLVVWTVCTVFSVLSMLPVDASAATLRGIALASVGMLLTQWVLVAIGLLCAALTKTYARGMGLAAIVLIAAYLIGAAVEIEGANALNFLSPIRYFPSGSVARYGPNPLYIGLSVIVVALCVGVSLVRQRKREFPA